MTHPPASSDAVLVVGAGISGAACARALAGAEVPVRLVDRGRRPGGRMASRRLDGRVVDLGASYLTAPEGSPFAAVVDGWVARGLARPWTDTFAVAGPDGLRDRRTGPVRYAAPGGLRALVEDLVEGLRPEAGLTVAAVVPADDAGHAVTVDGAPVRAAVLAMPDPQARRLLPEGSAAHAALHGADTWRPAIAVVLRFGERSWPADLHGAFVHDSDVLGWVADDGDRRGDGAPVLVAHTVPAFAAAHLEDPDAVVAPVVAAVRAALGLVAEPVAAVAHRWTFSAPGEQHDGTSGLVDGVGVCGDAWGERSSVGTAWASGDALGRRLAGV
ncbi:NAD(P)/FAD-dependent oxidoreductase [Cellulomonas endophytica]|uniref:NAD(P)/FAD-dependent oxidoreductase n=1 Tax=Cellulomonas endophytica TaxID=2494735 RepID=UPI00101288D5|nr:FAD-dependent oxidoreductase [Cellulomonas endophytica]